MLTLLYGTGLLFTLMFATRDFIVVNSAIAKYICREHNGSKFKGDTMSAALIGEAYQPQKGEFNVLDASNKLLHWLELPGSTDLPDTIPPATVERLTDWSDAAVTDPQGALSRIRETLAELPPESARTTRFILAGFSDSQLDQLVPRHRSVAKRLRPVLRSALLAPLAPANADASVRLADPVESLEPVPADGSDSGVVASIEPITPPRTSVKRVADSVALRPSQARPIKEKMPQITEADLARTRGISYGVEAAKRLLGLLVPEEDEGDWREEALCAQTDPEAFFPEKGGSTREAKRICADCPVRSQCLAYALDHDERHGIWGGFSERERRRLKKVAPTASAALVASV